MRLYDEKRQMIEVGDHIRFTGVDDESLWILCEVKGLHRFPSFKELYDSYPKEDLGYGEDEEASFEDMYEYYSKERIQKYGAFAIEIAVLETFKNK